MAIKHRRSSRRREGYTWQTHRPLNCLVFILPTLLFFQIGTAYYGTSLLAPRHLGKLLRYFGATASYLPALLIVTVLLVQHIASRDKWTVEPKALAGMFGESVLWTTPLVAMSYLSGKLIAGAAASSPASDQLLQDLLQAAGAGVYEEFIFRLAMISLILLIFVDIFALPKSPVAIAAVVVSACLFSLYHFPFAAGPGANGFGWAEFAFFAAAGVYLAILFIARGFAVAVGTHTFFNLFVVLWGP